MKTTLYGLTGYTRAERVMRWGDVWVLTAKWLCRVVMVSLWMLFVVLLVLLFGRLVGCW